MRGGEFPGDINTPNPLSALANPRLTTIFAMLKLLVHNARDNLVDHARYGSPEHILEAGRRELSLWNGRCPAA
jgi:hypothetical protein